MNAYEKVSKQVYQLRDLLGNDDFLTYETHRPFVMELLTLRRLANKHHRLAEMECNGEGYLRGELYSWDNSKSWANSPSVFSEDKEETTIFQIESDKVEAKIKAICERLGLRVKFQGDPRGYTVKFYKGDRFLDIQG